MTEQTTPEVRRQREALTAAKQLHAATAAVVWRDGSRKGEAFAKIDLPAVRELGGSVELADGSADALVGEIYIREGLSLHPVSYIAAQKESAARQAVEDELRRFAAMAEGVRWTKIDLDERCDDGSKAWAFGDETAAVWEAEDSSGRASVEQRKDEPKFKYRLTFRPDDRHLPVLRYRFASEAEAKRVGALLLACNGFDLSDRWEDWD